MDEYDTDKNGTIEFLEFMNMIMDSSFKKKDQAKMFSHVRVCVGLCVTDYVFLSVYCISVHKCVAYTVYCVCTVFVLM